METRDCKFCRQPATYAPLREMEDLGIKIFFCSPCQAEYLYWCRDNNLAQNFSSVSIYAILNKKMFRWTVAADGHGQLWRVKKPGVPGHQLNKEMEALYYVKNATILDITPQNIKMKVSTWLPFL